MPLARLGFCRLLGAGFEYQSGSRASMVIALSSDFCLAPEILGRCL
jgi:hypothetical protein